MISTCVCVVLLALISLGTLPLSSTTHAGVAGGLTSLLASLLVALGADYYIRNEFLEDTKHVVERVARDSADSMEEGMARLEQQLRDNIASAARDSLRGELQIVRSLNALGVTDVHPGLAVHDLAARFSTANKSIKILQTWAPDMAQLAPPLVAAARRSVDIHILVLHPRSPAAEMRANELGHPRSWFEAQADTNLGYFARLLGSGEEGKTRVETYSGSATLALYETDGVWLVGLYPRGTESTTTLTLEVGDASSKFHALLAEHFQAVADTASGIPPSTLDRCSWADGS
jgi:hypothetical protein